MNAATDTSSADRYTLVTTGIGVCGVAWNAVGLTRVQLPESTVAQTEARLRGRGASLVVGKVPDAIVACVGRLAEYGSGARVEFADAPLDTRALSSFDAAIYRALRDVGWGRTTTYGALAAAAGEPGAARAVGVAMARNPWPIIVPCHRVLTSNGAMGGFSAYGGTMTKQKLLLLEGGGVEMLPLFGG